MPITVSELFNSAGLKIDGVVPWGGLPDEERAGIYVIALSGKVNKLVSLDTIPVSSDAVADWIKRVPLMRIDKQIPTVETLVERLSCFWLPNETILYIAQTDRPLKIRIRELYYQILGERSRHTGGHWLKALNNLESLYIYYSVLESEQRDAENALLTQFHMPQTKKQIQTHIEL